MRLNGRRESDNVDDRRGKGGGKAGLAGIGGIIAIVVITLLSGGDLSTVFQNLSQSGALSGGQTTEQNYQPTAEEEELAKFSKQILASTEDIWTEEFKKMGKTYQAPKMVLFTNAVESGCGNATSSTGPFYCSADQTVYIDLSFFSTMKKTLGADGDFAYAYVIAHEVGHHVQYLLGDLQKAHQQMSRVSEKEANQISVRLELQADFYAGVWGHLENKRFKSLEDGDIEEALNTASKIGDDYLQKKHQGYTVPESFNHGRADQRHKWLKKGLTTGDFTQGDTFSPNYNDL
ncbi:MAG: neutral zinc metallopeptidase [Bacteroidaceae bacterium]|jgi:predicted metalloprotease|nr:neutral zinc metallopeptidase [Bacteroidaceae bacterium]MBR6368081.1 neutral zinc metallopeptidase [Bacteroidaceae bacterium]